MKDVNSILLNLFPRNIKFLHSKVEHLIKSHLWLKVLLGMFLGLGVGLLLNPSAGFVSEEVSFPLGEWLALPGHLFLTLIQMIIVPLVITSIVRGIAASGDMKQLKATGLWLSIYFVCSTIIATILGIGLGLLLQPGSYIDSKVVEDLMSSSEQQKLERKTNILTEKSEALSLSTMPNRVIAVLPENPLNSIVEGEMLQIVIVSLILGLGLLSLSTASARPLLEIFGGLQEVCMNIVGYVMKLAPFAVFGLLAQAMIKTGTDVLVSLAVYSLVVIVGQLALLVLYLLIVSTLGKRNPFKFFSKIKEPFLFAFSTDSSAATLPVTIKTAEEKLNIRPSISQLVAPIGATINMDGTAVYQGIATLFMAQMFGVDLPLSVLISLVVTALGASIGAPAVPGVGIMVLASILKSVGIPIEGLAILIGLDRILERLRASLNVTGDLVACIVMDRFMPAHVSRKEEVERIEKVEKLQKTQNLDVIEI